MEEYWQNIASRIEWSQALDASADRAIEILPQVTLSVFLIFLVLLLMAWIYRGSAGDEEIEIPVSLITLQNCRDRELIIGPKHLRESSTHSGKAPRVIFFAQVPARGRREYKAASLPLTISVRSRNSANIYDQTYKEDSQDGGQIGIGAQTRGEIEKFFSELQHKEGRTLDVDTARFVVQIKYPSRMNIDYLMREHPDTSVRLAAWLFLLTSLYSTLQSVLF